MQILGIVGAGQMGRGIALVCARAGLNVLMNDIDERALNGAIESISAELDRLVARGKATPDEAKQALDLIAVTPDLTKLSDSHFIIEAATEILEVKQKVLSRIDRIARSDCVIATNTSSVSITKLSSRLSDPSRFIGIHFFNPVPVMDLVEVIRGLQTSDATFAAAIDFVKRVGKRAIQVKNSAGFLVNRVLIPMINESIFVLQEGVAHAAEIDQGMKLGANHPIGPLALADLIGLDTILEIMRVLSREFDDPKYRPAPMLAEMVDAGYLGRKSGQGFFSY
jgi:3-hydroxybutyryl-CoA dehydrogenase